VPEAFGAEELMLFGDSGSEHYAQKARQNDTDIGFVIIADMIGYPDRSNTVEQVTINRYSNTNPQQLSQLIYQYSGLLTSYGDGGSDLTPFYENNYEGIFLEEYQFNYGHYHSSTDLLLFLDITYCTKIIKGACGVLLSYESEITDVDDFTLPQNFTLFQNYPNPFNSGTVISYQIPAGFDGKGSVVKLKVFDILGNEIATLVNENKSPGKYTVHFDGLNISSGVYFYTLSYNNIFETKRMVLVK
ncbi:M28 family peptidase, partial [Bacteroidota bacterium]